MAKASFVIRSDAGDAIGAGQGPASIPNNCTVLSMASRLLLYFVVLVCFLQIHEAISGRLVRQLPSERTVQQLVDEVVNTAREDLARNLQVLKESVNNPAEVLQNMTQVLQGLGAQLQGMFADFERNLNRTAVAAT